MKRTLWIAFIFWLTHLAVKAQSIAVDTTQRPSCEATACAVETLPTEGTVRSFLQALYGYNSHGEFKIVGIKWSTTLANTPVIVVSFENPQRIQEFYLTADRQHAILGKVVPFGADPFGNDRELLRSKATGPWRGDPNARILIVEFGDLECPACKSVQPILKRIADSHPAVKFIFEDFPLSFHPWAKRAALFAQCVSKVDPEKFFGFLDRVYGLQETITPGNADDMLSRVAMNLDLKEPDIRMCVKNGGGTAEVDAAMQLGTDIGITATPTLIVNGRRLLVGGMSYEDLDAVVSYELGQTPKNATPSVTSAVRR